MTQLVLIFALLTGVVLQAVLPPTWAWLGAAPAPILLGIVLYVALAHSQLRMLGCALAAGLLQDALGQIPLGYSSFGFCLAGLAAHRFQDEVFEHAGVTHAVFGAAAGGLVTLVLYGLLGKDGSIGLSPVWAVKKIAGAALLGALVTPVECWLLARLELRLGSRPQEER